MRCIIARILNANIWYLYDRAMSLMDILFAMVLFIHKHFIHTNCVVYESKNIGVCGVRLE